MEKILGIIKTNKKLFIILIAILGVIVYINMPMSDKEKNQLLTKKISQKQYKDAYDFNSKNYDSSSSLYESNYEKIKKCESMGVSSLDEYNKIGKNIEVVDKKIDYSDDSCSIALKCKNNNSNINLKDVQIRINLKNYDKKDDKISTKVTIDSAMKANGGQTIVNGKIDNVKSNTYILDGIEVISCGSKLNDSEVDKNIKKDDSTGDYMKDYLDLINKIQTRIPEMKISSLYGDEFGKNLSVEVKLQHNLNSTYEIVSELPVLFETDLKNAGVTMITTSIKNEDGSINGLIGAELSGGTYKPTINTCK